MGWNSKFINCKNIKRKELILYCGQKYETNLKKIINNQNIKMKKLTILIKKSFIAIKIDLKKSKGKVKFYCFLLNTPFFN